MDLKNIASKYRPIPFWSWNEKLETEQTRAQIKQMDEAGLGGFFMHARGGLQTEYMGQAWFDNVTAAVEAAEAAGMRAWAYDENGWPSGLETAQSTAWAWNTSRSICGWRTPPAIRKPQSANAVNTGSTTKSIRFMWIPWMKKWWPSLSKYPMRPIMRNTATVLKAFSPMSPRYPETESPGALFLKKPIGSGTAKISWNAWNSCSCRWGTIRIPESSSGRW